MQKELEKTLKYIEDLKKSNANIREKFSKNQVDYDTLLEEVDSMIDDLKDYTIISSYLLDDFEEAKINKDILLLQDVKSNAEYELEQVWN
jgi:hypothetical protein